MSDKRIKILSPVIIIIVGLIIYSNSFNSTFHFDDIGDIVESSAIRNINDFRSLWDFCPRRVVGYYTIALNYHFHQLNVFGYHVVNVMIHLINALLVWWLVQLTLFTPALENKPIAASKYSLALMAALLFVSHPVQTQAVTYIVQRLASLATMFYFLSLALYVYARTHGNKLYLFGAAGLSALLGMFTKEITFTLPFAVVLYEFTFLNSSNWQSLFKEKRVWIGAICLILLISVVPLIYLYDHEAANLFNRTHPSQGHLYSITPASYLLTQFRVITTYIRLLFIPLNQNLDYDYPISNHLFEIPTLLSFLFLLFLFAFSIFMFKRNRFVSFGILFFFIALSVESSIIPIQNVIFEHRLYLPSFGFIIVFSAMIYYLLWQKNMKVALTIFLLIVGVNSVLTYSRNKVWQNDFSLWSDVVKKSPNKARPWNNLARYYLDKKNYQKAFIGYNKSIEINPDFFEAVYGRGILFQEIGDYEKAIADLSHAIEIEPGYFEAYNNRGFIYTMMHQYEKAFADFTMAIKINPNSEKVYNNLGLFYINLNEYDKAIYQFIKALRISPNYIEALNNLGQAYMDTKKYDSAINTFTQLINLEPKAHKFYFYRGKAHLYKNNKQAANKDFAHVQQLGGKIKTDFPIQ